MHRDNELVSSNVPREEDEATRHPVGDCVTIQPLSKDYGLTCRGCFPIWEIRGHHCSVSIGKGKSNIDYSTNQVDRSIRYCSHTIHPTSETGIA